MTLIGSVGIVLLVAIGSFDASAQQSLRAGSTEWGVQAVLVGTKRYEFDGGVSARNEGGAGIGIGVARNLNDYFAVGADLVFSTFDYRASVVPASGNPGSGFDTTGTMESATLRFHGTYYMLARAVTPFITAGLGATYLDTNIATGPPVSGCWVYPWFGAVCGSAVPTSTMTRFSYGAGIGLRYDLPDQSGFVRGLVGGEWMEIPDARGRVGYVQLRADFGLKF